MEKLTYKRLNEELVLIYVGKSISYLIPISSVLKPARYFLELTLTFFCLPEMDGWINGWMDGLIGGIDWWDKMYSFK